MSSWDEWFSSLSEDERAAAAALSARFGELGAHEPEGWAESEISEGMPQMARFLFLRRLWRDTIDAWAKPFALQDSDAAEKLLAAGADPELLVRFARGVAYDAAFAAIQILDDGHDTDAEDDLPGWQLVETDAGDGGPTGRHLDGLHEDFLGVDPSGNDGDDLWG